MTNPITKYESSAGTIHPIRTQKPKEGDFANTPPEAVTNSKVKAKISKGSREYGIRPRLLRVTREVTTTEEPARTIALTKTVPILTPAVFASEVCNEGVDIIIQGVTWKVAGKVEEDY